MGHFLKENWFKLIIVFTVLLTGLFISYFVFFKIQKEKSQLNEAEKQKSLENEIRCNEMGDKIYQAQLKEVGNGSYLVPQYKFINNRCLYKGGYIGTDSFSRFIVDVYTNKEILTWFVFKGKDFEGSETEWNTQSRALFGE